MILAFLITAFLALALGLFFGLIHLGYNLISQIIIDIRAANQQPQS